MQWLTAYFANGKVIGIYCSLMRFDFQNPVLTITDSVQIETADSCI